MKTKGKTIRIKNELPELLEAVCIHDNCPEWLRDAIWEAFNNQSSNLIYTADWWRGQLESIENDKKTETTSYSEPETSDGLRLVSSNDN